MTDLPLTAPATRVVMKIPSYGQPKYCDLPPLWGHIAELTVYLDEDPETKKLTVKTRFMDIGDHKSLADAIGIEPKSIRAEIGQMLHRRTIEESNGLYRVDVVYAAAWLRDEITVHKHRESGRKGMRVGRAIG